MIIQLGDQAHHIMDQPLEGVKLIAAGSQGVAQEQSPLANLRDLNPSGISGSRTTRLINSCQ